MSHKTRYVAKLVIVVGALALAPGCTPLIGAGFDKQVQELQWSTTTMLGADPGWSEELWWTLEVLGDPEWGELASSLSLLGW
ncbi:MAG: hypothetical protein O7J95_09730 [Planctomycetota bacterium]|nr:hypothetical protein [Planctomycetota bacterium]